MLARRPGRSTTRWQLSADHHLGCARALSFSCYRRGGLRRRLTRDEFPALGMHPQWPPLRKQRPRGMRCSRWHAPNSRKNSVGVLAAGSASSARCGKSRSFVGRRSRAFQVGLGHAQRSSIIARWFEDRLCRI
jgi:hypothetical protein